YFVVFFIPVAPLGSKRILEQCPSCQKHRLLSLKKWEEAKAKDIARLLQLLEENPNDTETVRQAIAVSTGYQDEGLFTQWSSGLAEHSLADPVVQADLGAADSYFARWPEAEAAFRKSLAARDTPEVRGQLGFALLKQDRPEEAEPHLQFILDEHLRDDVG